MSGEQELTVQNRWDEFEKTVNDYLNSIKVPINPINQDVEIALNLTSELINKLSYENCYEYAYVLDRYAFFLQTEVNKHKTKVLWAKHNLDVSIGNLINNYGTKYSKYEEKRLMIIADNIYCQALNKMILTGESIMTSLEHLSAKANIIGKTLKDTAYSKRYNNE